MVTHDVEASESSDTRDEATTSRSRLLPRGERGPRAPPFAPARDGRATADAIVLYVELAGVSPDDVDITLEDDVLTVSGERSSSEQVEDGEYLRVERSYGRFHRALRLPARIASDEITARYAGGILTVEVPKAHDARPRRVPVEAS